MTESVAGAATVAGSERVRLFCALQLGDETVEWLAAWQAANLPRGRVVPRENLHVTLAFLGHRRAGEVQAIAGELRAASAQAGPIELRPLRYRETRSVGMVVLEDASGAAAALAEDIQGRLEQVGVYRRERRPWLPHITVLRFQSPAGLAPGVANTCSIHVVRSALYRSVLGAGGARYEILRNFEIQSEALGG
ncbi:MAG TPA: RNA 2',3'-cyclic phosphodiesterase [Gaiellaceae bacterium]|nr:RNA 2',3'-cyclic phosphodiesterase [Gaiellaceae bacterium]